MLALLNLSISGREEDGFRCWLLQYLIRITLKTGGYNILNVYVLNKDKKPLMPTSPVIARLLLKNKKAKVVRKTPFTIKLLYETTEHKQPVIAGMDTGSRTIGCAAIANDEVIYQSEVQLRTDISKKMTQRASYRRTRRNRITRYRPARFDNRGKKGKIAPSIKSKVDSHLREKRFVEAIVPVTKWKVELASFDIHKIVNPEIKGKQYQEGNQKGFYNVKAYVLDRDNYTCQHCKGKSKDKHLECHHIIFQSNGGSDALENMIVLCNTCHKELHDGKFSINEQVSRTKYATEIGIIKSQLGRFDWQFESTFGYETKYKREKVMELPKTHYNDAIAICCKEDQNINLADTVYFKKHVSKGDYQQTKGKRSEKKIPTGKLFGLRKFDLIKTMKGIGFVKGKRSSGYFAICDIFNKTIHNSVGVKTKCTRIQARTTTLVQPQMLTI
ncbi:RNA-guided endonuclease IscB [Methanococcoides sp. NM1]|uniref:RNA-guided endonuclease IscB n=1 Tax=Methanococcoides sp. NM1 TaxID=1201013 RepID=UPI001FCE6F3B|nr:RNA-guided endonuclease IscB [Methanococcoides sp. NM1]